MQALNARGSTKQVWVGSAGASGYASDAHAAFIKSSPLMNQIDVLVVMVGVNDLAKSLANEGTNMPAGGEVRRPELIGRPLWRRSRALIEAGVLVKRVRQRLTQGSIAYEDVDGKSYVERRLRRRTARQSDDTTGLLEGNAVFDQYPRNIRGIIAACRGAGVRPIFVTQPVLWTENMSEQAKDLLWFGWREDGSYLSVSSLRGLMDRYNAVLRETCVAEGVECIDLSSMDGHTEWFYDDCHFNEAGAREVARLISAHLR
jgi:lysophospholipase L1-like esterase